MSEPVAAKLAEHSQLQAGKHWEGRVINGEFRLREYLGGSDHSAVFLTDLYDRDNHTAAIKVVAADSPSAQALLNSCELAAPLSHPNLIHILTVGRAQIDGTNIAYALMEYAEENLAQVVSQRPLTSNETREMLKPALQALSYLHAKGFVHAGLKPANILASGDQLRLSVDSICRSCEPLVDATPYDAPEGTASPAADSWSLGMALVEVLTQNLPEWNQAREEEPLVPEFVPEPFREIARNCVRRDPKDRWTVSVIANHLNPSATVEPESAPGRRAEPANEKPATAFEAALEAARASYEPPPESRQRSASVYLIPAVVLCVALAGLVLWFTRGSGSRPSSQLPVAESTPTPPIVALGTPPKAVAANHAPRPQPATALVKPAAPAKRPASTGLTPPAARPSLENAEATRPAAVGFTASAGPAASDGVVRQALPKVSQNALDTIHGSVRVSVRVDIDSAGTVKYAKFQSAGPSQYFANQALSASRAWKFASVGHPSQRVIQFVFTQNGIDASTSPE